MGTRILVTGVCGFVGSILTKAMLEADPTRHIIGIDNLSRPGSWVNLEDLQRRGVAIHHGDVRCQSDLDSLPACDWVIDAAANPSVLGGVLGHASPRTVIENNLIGTVNILEYCRQRKAGLILLSTSRVLSIHSLRQIALNTHNNAFQLDFAIPMMNGVSQQGIDESFSTQAPISLYGATKLASEQLALEYGSTFDFPVWINRCGVLAGAGQFARIDQGIIAYWLHQWHAKQCSLQYLSFGGCGYQVRDCLHPADLARLIELQIQRTHIGDCPQTYNVSGGMQSSRSLRQLSQWCENRWGPHEVLSSQESRPYDIPWLVLNSQLAASVWGWTPQVNTDAILDEIAAFAETNPQWLRITDGYR
jgi:CDP-paratose 2-epimerase